jgi:hypothetical protein
MRTNWPFYTNYFYFIQQEDYNIGFVEKLQFFPEHWQKSQNNSHPNIDFFWKPFRICRMRNSDKKTKIESTTFGSWLEPG